MASRTNRGRWALEAMELLAIVPAFSEIFSGSKKQGPYTSNSAHFLSLA